MKILIIDDDVFLQKAMSFNLLQKGHTITIASNGQEAIKFLEKHNDYELIICDVMLPFLTGPSLILMLKKYFPKQLPYIIIVSGVKDGEDFLKKIEINYDYFFKKPLDYDKFDHAVNIISMLKDNPA